jgi:hypothetical protein
VADRGYVLLWRKFWDNKTFKSSHPFSEREAWLYLFSNLANGIDRNGLGRGQFQVSIRYLAKAWGWSKTKVERFVVKLEQNSMIARVGQSSGQQSGQQSGHFTICNYEAYQKPWDSNRDTKRDTKRDKSKEGVNERENTKAIPASPKHKSASVPAGFKIEESMLAWASQHVPSVNVESETASFLDHHTAKGSTFRDWTAAWRTWMRNSQKWQKPSYHQETIDEQLERLRRKNDSKPGSVVR